MTAHAAPAGPAGQGRIDCCRGAPRLFATMVSVALLGACVDGGSDPPQTNVDNTVPAASAGADQSVFALLPVTLDGSASSDADGDKLTYDWAFESRPAGSSAELTSTTEDPDIATFTPDVPGNYVVGLTVDDGFAGGTDSDFVSITANTPPPVANAGPDQPVTFSAPGVTAQLDGSASSDPSGLPLTYAWEIASFVPASGLPPATPVTLANASTANASFAVTAVDQLGTYTLSLTVNNGALSASDQVIVTVAGIPAPIANAGADQDVVFVVAGTTVSLDGTGSSDPSSLPLTYAWEILSFQSASGDPPAANAILVGADTPTPTFDVTALDQLGSYTIQLAVSNGTLASTDQVIVTVAKTFPAAGGLLGSALLGCAVVVLRRWWQRRRPASQRAVR